MEQERKRERKKEREREGEAIIQLLFFSLCRKRKGAVMRSEVTSSRQKLLQSFPMTNSAPLYCALLCSTLSPFLFLVGKVSISGVECLPCEADQSTEEQ